MQRTPSLKHMSFKRALVYAKALSGMTKEEIAEASGLSPANVARYFQEYDTYAPSPAHIPALCRAMGNTVLADWVQAHVEEVAPAPEISSPTSLARAVMGTTANNGELSRLASEALADGSFSPDEAQELIGRVDANIKHLQGLRVGLEPLAGQIMRGGKWVKTEVRQ